MFFPFDIRQKEHFVITHLQTTVSMYSALSAFFERKKIIEVCQ